MPTELVALSAVGCFSAGVWFVVFRNGRNPEVIFLSLAIVVAIIFWAAN